MSARYVYATITVLILTAFYACWCRAPLIWDGAYQFNATLIMQSPYFYLTRFHTYFLWWPTVWASRVTSNVTLLQTIYGLPFLLALAIGVTISWWIVRKDAPYLITWVIFGVIAGALPGQIFVINDSIFQQHLFWPIFVSLFVPLSLPKKITIGILTIFQFVHPLGILLFFGTMMAGLLMAAFDRENRHRLLVRSTVMASLFLLTVGKIYLATWIPGLYDTYAAEEGRLSTAIDRWGAGVRGWPLHGLWFMWAAAGMSFLWLRWRGGLTRLAMTRLLVLLYIALGIMAFEYRRHPLDGLYSAAACIIFYVFLAQFRRAGQVRPMVGIMPLLCVAIGAACWIHWAADGHLWWKAIDYRRWVGPLTGPFFMCAVFDAVAEARKRNDTDEPRPAGRNADEISTRRPLRQPVVVLATATFAIVFCMQCTEWHRTSAQLMDEVYRYPARIVPEAAIPWIKESPMDHWANADYVMAMQGKKPTKLLLSPVGEEHIYENPPKIPHWDFYPGAREHGPDPTPGPVGWFDLRPLLKQISREPRPKKITGPLRLDVNSTPQ